MAYSRRPGQFLWMWTCGCCLTFSWTESTAICGTLTWSNPTASAASIPTMMLDTMQVCSAGAHHASNNALYRDLFVGFFWGFFSILCLACLSVVPAADTKSGFSPAALMAGHFSENIDCQPLRPSQRLPSQEIFHPRSLTPNRLTNKQLFKLTPTLLCFFGSDLSFKTFHPSPSPLPFFSTKWSLNYWIHKQIHKSFVFSVQPIFNDEIIQNSNWCFTPAGYVIEPLPSKSKGCSICYVSATDPRGSIPVWAVNKGTQYFAPKVNPFPSHFHATAFLTTVRLPPPPSPPPKDDENAAQSLPWLCRMEKSKRSRLQTLDLPRTNQSSKAEHFCPAGNYRLTFVAQRIQIFKLYKKTIQ